MEIALKIDTPALGDTLAAIPTLRKLCEAYESTLTIFTSKPFLFENHPLVKEALPLNASTEGYKVYTTFSPLVGNAGQSMSTTPGASTMSNLGGLAQMYSLF